MGKPNPGTDAALAAGCTCPVIDNHYGRGYRGRAGEFVFSGGCPVHADEQEFERDDDHLRSETEAR